jgi:hypothetical protein
MRNSILLGACLLVCTGVSGPASAQDGTSAAASANTVASATTRAPCDAKYYGYLVGGSIDQARSIEGSNYRLLSAGSPRGDANMKRMTIVYDPKSNQITEVACG